MNDELLTYWVALRDDCLKLVGILKAGKPVVTTVALQNNVITMPQSTEAQIVANTPPNDTMVPWVFNVRGSENNRHNVRVLCDLGGLDLVGKNTITACIEQESDFNPSEVGPVNENGTKDWGICQYNDGSIRGIPLWIGEGAAFPSTDYVLNNPTADVNLMISEYKKGNIRLWVSYSSGAYKKFMPQGTAAA